MATSKLRTWLFGKPLDPTRADTRDSLALAAFLAWVGLGADGLSSSAYGPEEAFKALGTHTQLGLYLALATAITVFVIALAYNQIIELFPTGGGGYRVATTLLGPNAGLVAGAALIVDYMLTIAISAAAGVDAVFSLLPSHMVGYKLACSFATVILLLYLNLRGIRESILVLLPIFGGFAITHALLIVYGIGAHADGLDDLVPATLNETFKLASETSWMFVVALFMKAYSLGGGTYTGIEAVSNNVQHLAEPREKTGKATMLLMAASLAFTAGGIIVLYLLWSAKPSEHETLNAIVFRDILANAGFQQHGLTIALTVVLAFEAGLLFIAANTGFLGGPAVLSNMAADSWVPHKFRYLSQRLVTQNGLVVMGVGALVILFLTRGQVDFLVVLYSINVFLTFTLSLLGLVIYWIRHKERSHRARRLALSISGFLITLAILIGTIVEKFFEGGWVTILITGLVIALCKLVHSHYEETRAKINDVDEVFANQPFGSRTDFPKPDPNLATAAFLVGSSRGGGLHALLWVQRMFPDHFSNFLFISARTVDAHAYGGREALESLQTDARVSLKYFENFCHSHGYASKSYLGFGTDAIEEVDKLCSRARQEFPNVIFFTSKLIFQRENWLTRLLHNQAASALQRRLHLDGMQLVILPMRV